jgi:exodeoxyribonuclease V alpha subunit
VAHIRYRKEDGFFAVITLQLGKDGHITVVGQLPGVDLDDEIKVSGKWVKSQHGEQLTVESYEPILPVTPDGIIRYLSAQLDGIGPRTAKRIVDTFGEETLRVFDETPHRLSVIKGIGPNKLPKLVTQWQQRAGQRNAFLFFQSHGITFSLCTRILRELGPEAVAMVRSDPYALARRIHGIGFFTADRIARQFGFDLEAPARLEAGVAHAIATAESNNGHCYVERSALLQEAAQLLSVANDGEQERQYVSPEKLSEAIEAMLEKGSLREDQLQRAPSELHDESALDYTTEPLRLLFRRPTWNAEVFVAQRMLRMLEKASPVRASRSVQSFIEEVEADLKLELAPQQRRAVELGLSGQVLLVTGGPGTGKTTLIRVLVEACKRLGQEIHLAAPTGRAAKRLSEATNVDAKTLHRLLEFSFQSHGFQRNAELPLPAASYVVDESSMIDIQLMRALLTALPETSRLILVGDVDQLPSVGPGAVLKDLIASELIPVVRLTEIFRQAAASLIVRNAHRINQGQLPISPEPTEEQLSEFYAMRVVGGTAAQKAIIRLVCERIPQVFGLDPMREVQVLSPMRKGDGGTDALNVLLQAQLNPKGTPIGRPDGRLRVGDRVMQLRNDYDKDVFNGDVGSISHYDVVNKEVVIDFDERRVKYNLSELEDLSLAYATTVHKAQGSEYPAVVLCLLKAQRVMLQRNLIYTALTRARRIAVFVIEEWALKTAVHNADPSSRNTLLAHRIRVGTRNEERGARELE